MSEKFSSKDLQRLQREIENQLAWGPASSWHSSMFEELSEKVFHSSEIVLSVPTLKRFFGVVNHDGAPSITTLDALSRFVGKENWREFKLTRTTRFQKRIGSPRKSVYVTVGFILALVIISLIGNKRPELVINASDFAFSSTVLSKEYPNSVVFNLAIPPSLQVDSLTIQQYWDPTKTVEVSKRQSEATAIYYFPGYFKAKLLVEGQVVKEHDLFLKSNGWLGTIEYRPVPKYFQPIAQVGLKFPHEIAQEVATLEEPVLSTFHYIDDFGDVSGDNFSFSATIQNTFDDRWAVCQAVYIFFIGTDGAMIVPISKIGCSSDNNLMLNDVFLRGKENDLSSLSADFTTPVDIVVNIKDKEFQASINGKDVYTNSYQETMGRLVGLRFKFKGLGEIFEYQVLNEDEEPLQF